MKEIKRLERILTFLEWTNLSLLTLCLSLPFALLFPGDNPLVSILWGFGALIPVNLICLLCLKVKEKPKQYLFCAIVFTLAILLPDNSLRRFYYGFCCLPILISGLWIQRPRGKLILTVPRAYHPIAALLAYSFGKIAREPVMTSLGIALVALMILVFCFYYNQDKLLQTLRDTYRTEVSRRSIITINRRVTAAFVVLSILILGAVPFLIRQQEQTPVPVALVEVTETSSTAPSETETQPIEIDVTERPEAYNYDAAVDTVEYIVLGGIAVLLIMLVIALVSALRGIYGSRSKHSTPKEEQEWQMERLETERKDKAGENLTGYEKKLRRRYEKLIRSRTEKDAALAPLTPVELGEAAKLRGPAADAVRALYERTRYSPEPADKEIYSQFKEAVRDIQSEGK